ncbi:hypothetical protein B5F77_08835 [Parabacteroides sp. An277]|uniref:DUF6383 domain-containing protein n=1 Tax=Parabacteroides sp. An277 TaxID=1965619 RepID=UPI000B389579|nr:DUF6383 domain-containing protein [Parabacteroides sp. An277]OUO52207.1 hypothetical protein B5F77_08835 [Parabacteroides sp. An277]
MNKKVLTLCAGLVLAGSVNTWAKTDVNANVTANGGYAIQSTSGSFNKFLADKSSWNQTTASDYDYPKVSPFSIERSNGAKPIYKLDNTDGQTDSRYFQLVVGENGNGGSEVLTMVWTGTEYKLQVENVQNANIPGYEIQLDRTLWEVRAKKDPVSTVIYYQLINKASNMALQLSTNAVANSEFTTLGGETYKEANLTIVSGQTNWRWSDGAEAINETTPLSNMLRAAFSDTETVYLVKKKSGNDYTLAALVTNSNNNRTVEASATSGSEIENGLTEYSAIKFEAWEANPIVLTAAQLNSELGYENIASEGEGKKDGFKFYFYPDVVGPNATNVMLGSEFTAVAPVTPGTNRVPGDTPDGFVRFQKKGTNQFLMVDTTYYNEDAQDRYELQMAVREINYPRFAVVEDEKTVSDIDAAKSDKSLYTGAYTSVTEKYTAKSYIQMLRQSNFRAILYPATQSVRLQAEMIYKKAKTDEPWWKQVAEDETIRGEQRISEYASAPLGTNPLAVTSGIVNAVGFYPAHTYDATNNRQGHRVLTYATAVTVSPYTNNYAEFTNRTSGVKMIWNAIGTLAVKGSTVSAVASADAEDMLVKDPANNSKNIYSPVFATAFSNVVKLVTLTDTHKVLTADEMDINDKEYNGLLTFITITDTKPVTDDLANIQNGYYYIINANKVPTQLRKAGDYRMEDLAATNATFAYWNALSGKWDVAVAGTEESGILAYNQSDYQTRMDSESWMNADKGNVVYVEDKVEVPSAQWFIEGNGGYYTMYNRESGRVWNTSYWWRVPDKENTYVNMATYTDGTGLSTSYRDTIRIEPVEVNVLRNHKLGYLDLTAEEAAADTSVYSFGFNTLGDVELYLGQAAGTDSLLQVAGLEGKFKLERVNFVDKDLYSSAKKDTTSLFYGINPAIDGAEKEYQLDRGLYYIYKDDVNANTGDATTGVRTREYVTLEAGKYRLTSVQVTIDSKNGFSTIADQEVISGTKLDPRRSFFVKQVAEGNHYVLVDPYTVSREENNNATNTKYYGVRAFVNQLSGEVQPASLVSAGASNAFDNSVFTINKEQGLNYFDIRRDGADLDTVKIFVANNPSYLLGENSNVKGANVGLLDLREVSDKINNALFVDTANVNNPACPRFLLGVRDTKAYEESNLDHHHNRHLYTDAAYLVNLIDSVADNTAYLYKNAGQNQKNYYRLGFLDGRHKGTTLTLDESGKPFDLSDAALGETGLNYATFAFRYCDASREDFYIETQYDANTKGWIKIHNGVAVVTPDIQEAEVFSYEATEEDATANESIAAENNAVSVVATDGAVVIKGAEGKNVVIATILGKVVANETVNSDNETIAVPAGIAVVSVDGESFKVVVK